MAREDLIEYIDDAVSWMVAAKKSHPTLLLPGWVAQWQINRPTKRAADAACACPRVKGEIYHIAGCPVIFYESLRR